MPRLQILNGKRQGAVFDVPHGGELVIGHRATASIAIDDPWVSWDHARIYFQGSHCHIEDLGSTNGTYVNCVRVKREELRHEDIVFLGKTHVLFLAPTTSGVDDPFVVADSGSIPATIPHAKPAGISSEFGPFNSASGSPPLVDIPLDPFAAAAAQRDVLGDMFPAGGPSGSGGVKDPFAQGVDPFASGPDYSDIQVPFQAAQGSQPSQSGQTVQLRDGRVRDDLVISRSFEETQGGTEPRVPTRVTSPFSDDPISSGVLSVSYGGGFEPNALGVPPDPSAPTQPPAYAAVSQPTQPPPYAGLSQPTRSPFAETRGDESLSPLRDESAATTKPSRSLSLSQLDDDGEPELPAPSTREIANLLEASGRRRRGTTRPSSPDNSDELDQLPESEMRTREIDATEVESILAEHEALEALAAGGPPSRGVFAEPTPAAPPLGSESTHADLLARVAAEQGDAAVAVYENARLKSEVARLRLALEAAQQQNPQAVQVAAQALRDRELTRLAERVAELERDLAGARATLAEREEELDAVTEDMIEKEDRIDQLEHQLRGRGVQSPEDYSSLEF